MAARSLGALLLLLLSAGSCLAERRLLHGGHAHEEAAAAADAPAAGVEPMPTGHVRSQPAVQSICISCQKLSANGVSIRDTSNHGSHGTREARRHMWSLLLCRGQLFSKTLSAHRQN